METLSTPDLDEVAGVIADATGAEGTWESPGGAGGEPGAPADSSEAALGDRARGGVGARGERPCLALTLWWTGGPRPQRVGT